MATLEELLDQIRDIARREQRPVEDVLAAMLHDYEAEREAAADAPAPNREIHERDPLRLIAQAADEFGRGSGDGTISERSREILNRDWADSLARRIRGEDADE